MITDYSINMGSNQNQNGIYVHQTYIGPEWRSTDDKIRKYGSLLGAGLLVAGVASLCSSLGIAVGISLVAAGTIILISSLFKFVSRTTTTSPSLDVKGSRKCVEKSIELNLETVRKLKIDHPHRVIFQQGEKPELRVTGEDNILDLMSETIEGGDQLSLSSKQNVSYHCNHLITYHLTLPKIDEIILSGTGKFETESLNVESLQCRLSGTGRLLINNLAAKSLNCNLSGTGKIKIAGVVEKQSIHLSGTSSYEASKLISQKTTVNGSGTGTAFVHANESFYANLSGTSRCVYSGNPPDCNIHCTGTGSVVPIL